MATPPATGLFWKILFDQIVNCLQIIDFQFLIADKILAAMAASGSEGWKNQVYYVSVNVAIILKLSVFSFK